MSLGATMEKDLATSKAFNLWWHTTGVELARNDVALYEVSHNDSSAAKHGERCPGGWYSETARTTLAAGPQGRWDGRSPGEKVKK